MNPSNTEPDLSLELESNETLAFMVLQPPIAFHRIYVDITGSATAALLLSACIPDLDLEQGTLGDWSRVSCDALQNLTGLSRKEQASARKTLRDQGLLEERRIGFPAQFEMRLKFSKLAQKMIEKARLVDERIATDAAVKH